MYNTCATNYLTMNPFSLLILNIDDNSKCEIDPYNSMLMMLNRMVNPNRNNDDCYDEFYLAMSSRRVDES